MDLPADDPAFAPLRHAAVIDPEEYPRIRAGHRQAVIDAARGRSLRQLRVTERSMLRDARHTRSRDDELEAWGYALGVTAVRVALREHDEQAVQEVA
jgi:hypothetical protein